MNTRKSLDGFAIGVMLLLCICWGLQQTAIKVAAPSISPMMQIALRSMISVILLSVFMWWRGKIFSLRDGRFWPGIAVGTLFSLEYVCVSVGLMYTTASHMTVFLYTSPFFTALGLHWFVPKERLQAKQFIGIGIAFAGIALAFSGGFQTYLKDWHEILIGDVLGILGGIFWAMTIIVIRTSSLSEAPATQTLMYQLAVCAIILLSLGLILPPAPEKLITNIAWLSLLFQGVIFCFISFCWYGFGCYDTI